MFKTKNKKGYTITEIMVVMSIMAFFAMLGAFGMMAARNGARVDETAQGIVSALRQAQNKAVAVEMRYDGSFTTKAWGVKIVATPSASTTPGSYQLISYEEKADINEDALTIDDTESTETPFCGESGENCVSIPEIKIYKYETVNIATETPDILDIVYIIYSSPFARPYIITESTGCDSSNYNTGDCWWQESTNPAQDWEPTTSQINDYFSDYFYKPDRQIKLVLSYKGKMQNIWIKSNGDNYLE